MTDEESAASELIADVSLGRRLLNWKTIGSIVFGIVLLILLFRYVFNQDLGEIWASISHANPAFLLLAFVAYYLTFPLRGFRWAYLLRNSGTPIATSDATEILFLSWFVNCVVPAKLGDVYRAYLLRGNYRASMSRTVGTIFIERSADIIVIFALALAAGFWSFRGRSRPDVDAVFFAGFVVAIGLVAFVVGLRFYGHRLTQYLPGPVAELYERFHEGSTRGLTRRTLPILGAVTVAIWILEGIRLYFVIHALDLPAVGLGISASIFVTLIGALLTAVPLTPAGVGFVEAAIVIALGFYGIAGVPASAVALTDRAISILSVIVLGGILYAFSRKVRVAHGVGAPQTAPD
jgi:glycosyltransferase 2 family protein